MKIIIIIFIIYFSSFIKVESSTTVNFETSGDGYTVSGNVITLTGEGPFDLTGDIYSKKIIVSSSCKLNLNSLELTNTDSLTPLIISENKAVELVLTGESTLIDSSHNENEGTIYLQKGASLTISGTGTLNLLPSKNMAINGTEGTSLTVKDGVEIIIAPSSKETGGIYLRKEINLNDAKITYSCDECKNHAIDSEGDIKLVEGTYSLKSGKGKGIQSEKNLYIGIENGDNSDLKLSITASNEGIEAMGITIYSGQISIDATDDGINAASSGDECSDKVQCSGNCACFITFKGGNLELISEQDGLDSNGDITISGGYIQIFAASDSADQPIDQNGLLKITGGAIIAAGSSSMSGVIGQTTQVAKEYKGKISEGAQILITDSNGAEIIRITTPKEANYIYLNYKSAFTVKINNAEITLSEPSNENNQRPGGPGNPNDRQNNNDNSDFGSFLRMSNLILLLSISFL